MENKYTKFKVEVISKGSFLGESFIEGHISKTEIITIRLNVDALRAWVRSSMRSIAKHYDLTKYDNIKEEIFLLRREQEEKRNEVEKQIINALNIERAEATGYVSVTHIDHDVFAVFNYTEIVDEIERSQANE